ncbi:Protein yceI precursor [hydrothermal vent metagenome]|uniref:Protein yceI n=1 Tax=hydrothermal vent metagenome TaxID=652676 RepID=A0A3B1AQ02_9ZZZZ
MHTFFSTGLKACVVVLALSLLPFAVVADSYTIDPSHTYPNFKIDHLGFSTMYGRFGKTSGRISMDRAEGSGSVDIVIDAASIDTGHAKRDDHLRSPDFFNVTEFPQITFKSNTVKYVGDGASVTGDLIIMGVTRSVTLDIPRINCGTHPFNKKQVCGFNATTRFKRSDFGMNYGLPGIGDEVSLDIEVEAFKD